MFSCFISFCLRTAVDPYHLERKRSVVHAVLQAPLARHISCELRLLLQSQRNSSVIWLSGKYPRHSVLEQDVWTELFSKIPADINALLQKLDLLPLFARPPKWASRQTEKLLTFCYNHLRHHTAEVRLTLEVTGASPRSG